jgi:rubredoxin
MPPSTSPALTWFAWRVATSWQINQQEVAAVKKWECLVCGYIYDPEEHDNVPFEDLADDWVCPDCGAGKDMFEAIE